MTPGSYLEGQISQETGVAFTFPTFLLIVPFPPSNERPLITRPTTQEACLEVNPAMWIASWFRNRVSNGPQTNWEGLMKCTMNIFGVKREELLNCSMRARLIVRSVPFAFAHTCSVYSMIWRLQGPFIHMWHRSCFYKLPSKRDAAKTTSDSYCETSVRANVISLLRIGYWSNWNGG